VRVALTGGTGYTGGRLARRLRADGHQVVALARAGARTSDLEGVADLVAGDLADRVAIDRLVSGADAVTHVAAVYRTAGHPDSYYREINVGGTERLLEASARAGVARFVHTSTVGVHGDVRNPPATEDSPMEPGDVYQETKAEAERLALDFGVKRGLPVAVVRPGAIYGPRETRLLKIFRAVARGRYAVVGDGRPHYHLVWVDDLIDGFLLAMTRPEAVGQAFLIAGPRSLSQDELARLVASATGGRLLPFHVPAWPLQAAGDLVEALCVPFGIEPPIHRRRVDFWVKNRSFSIEKARRLLGYAPKVDVEEGLARCVASYREAGWL